LPPRDFKEGARRFAQVAHSMRHRPEVTDTLGDVAMSRVSAERGRVRGSAQCLGTTDGTTGGAERARGECDADASGRRGKLARCATTSRLSARYGQVGRGTPSESKPQDDVSVGPHAFRTRTR
jgi:hypothetical protein